MCDFLVKVVTPLIDSEGKSSIELKVLTREKSDKDAANYSELIKAIKAAGATKVGVVKKDKPKGPFANRFMSLLSKDSDLEVVDCAIGLASAMSVKDATAQANIRHAAQFTSSLLRRYALPKVESVVDQEKKISHTNLADDIVNIYDEPSKVKSKLDPEDLDLAYNPIIQSGGRYDHKAGAMSDENLLKHEGAIIVRLGSKYKNYNANIGRTYFINPTKYQEEVYKVLTQVYRSCLSKLKSGNSLADVYNAAKSIINKMKPEIKDHFVANCGTGIGLEFREASYVLSGKGGKNILQAGMIYNLSIGFRHLHVNGKNVSPDDTKVSDKIFGCFLSDTIRVTADDAESLTVAKRDWSDVSYYNEDDVSESDEDSESDDEKNRGIKKGALRTDKNKDDESSLQQQQRRLAQKRREEELRKFSSDKMDKQFDSKMPSKDRVFASYKNAGSLPNNLRQDRIYVDVSAESVLLPVTGQLVPFHISTIKNCHKTEASGFTTLTITFVTPQGAGGAQLPSFLDRKCKFIKEMTFRSSSGTIGKTYFDIKELKKRVQNRLKEHEAKASLVVQEDLILNKKGNQIKLNNISVKPYTRKKTHGYIEAHVNGFRVVTNNGSSRQKIDIIYKNIKAAFYHPANKKRLAVVLHLQLHNKIILDKKKSKKTDYIQIYQDLVEASQDLAESKRYYDEDGLLEEQEERRNRKKWNDRFKGFVQKVQSYLQEAKNQPEIEFDIPYEKLTFKGKPQKTTVDIYPSVRGLVSLEDNPPFVVVLDEVDVVFFERVNFNLRNFDMTIIYKDLDRAPSKAESIPSKQLDSIKNWLVASEVNFYESPVNLLWKNIIADIKKDVKQFWDDGGWGLITGGDESEGEGESAEEMDDGESDFEPDDSGSDGEEEFDSGSDFSDSSEDESEEEDDEEVDDWDEHEKLALKADKKKNYSADSNPRPKKRSRR